MRLTDRIFYLPATNYPLSSNVVVIHGDRFNWIYDVGSSDEAREMIIGLTGEKNIVISHFHEDHMGNLKKLTFDNLYCGAFTAKKIQQGSIVTSELTFDDGISLTIFPIPSTHSKGCVGLQVDKTIAFIGDAIYTQSKDGRAAYNVNILKEMIDCFEQIEANQIAVSHSPQFVKDKESILSDLREIYQTRRSGESYIFIG